MVTQAQASTASVPGMGEFRTRCDRAFELLGADLDAVLIVPPFADICRPASVCIYCRPAPHAPGLASESCTPTCCSPR